jgi:tetratricopeptide (TPR) repeat protein
MNNLLLLFFCILLAFKSNSQLSEDKIENLLLNGSIDQLVHESTQLIENNQFHQANLITNKLLEKDPQNCNFNYRKGYILLEYTGNFIEAENYLIKASEKVNLNYDFFSSKETSASIDAYYYLGKTKHMLGKVEEAEVYYNRFLKESIKKSVLNPMAELALKQCSVARNQLARPNPNIQVRNIGNVINSNFPEYSPIISLDGSALYFTSRRPWNTNTTNLLNENLEDIYVSVLTENEDWTTPTRLDFCLQNENEASVAVSFDERRIYIYRDQNGGGDIYFSDFSNNKFNAITADKRKGLNTFNWETHCSVTLDGNTMYFVSDRKGGYGGRDIYKMEKNTTGEWGDPMNLGPTINSKYDEDGAFIAIDNKTLYFSSNNEKSMGGFDVFISELDENGNWSTPVNLGYPLNTCGDEIYYTTTLDGRKGYLTSYRVDGFGEKDIYEILHNYAGVKDVSYLDGVIKTSDNKALPEDIKATLVCTDCLDKKPFDITPRLRDGSFFTSINPCKTYVITFTANNGQNILYTEKIFSSCEVPIAMNKKTYILDVDKMIITPEFPVQEIVEIPVSEYENVDFVYFFDYNINKLSPKKRDLKKFMKVIEAQLESGRERITLNIYSSASTVPTRKYKDNEELARLRAENIKYDLMEYIQKASKFNKNAINVVIVSSVVDGPNYENDSFKKDKYKKYQFFKIVSE